MLWRITLSLRVFSCGSSPEQSARAEPVGQVGEAAGGMTWARRPAGAGKPAPSTSAGSRRPDARTGRARARRLSPLLPVLTLLAGMLSLFAPAPAEAQAYVWGATLTVQNLGSPVFGCGTSGSSRLHINERAHGQRLHPRWRHVWDQRLFTLTTGGGLAGTLSSIGSTRQSLRVSRRF